MSLPLMKSIVLVCICALTPVLPLAAQDAAANTPQPLDPGGSGKNVIGFTSAPVSEVLAEYYRVTGRRVLRDRGMENAVVTIDVPGEFSDEEYRVILEKGLLMHGYVLVPSGDNLFKLVAAELGSMPGAQRVPMILRAEDLPNDDQVVMHVLQLNHIDAAEAAAAFQQVIPLHPYGNILAVANSQALVITEASQTIRAYMDLAGQVDQPPAETVQKTFRLERGEAEEVVTQLQALLGLRGGNSFQQEPASQTLVVGATTPAATGILSDDGGSDEPMMQAVPRTNSIIVVARPLDMKKIENLVAELDAESSNKRFISRRLNYLDLAVFLDIAEKALQRNERAASASDSRSTSGTPNTAVAAPATYGQSSSFSQSAGFNSAAPLNGGASAGSFGGISGASSSGSLNSQPLNNPVNSSSQLDITKKPLSVLIANTLVIADPASSKFFASGPPDQIQALQELADELDVRPRQILLSAIIGEFTVGDDFNFGLDWIQSLKQAGDGDLVGGVLNTQGTAFANPANLGNIAGFLGAAGPAALPGLTAYGQFNRNLNVFLQTLESTRRFHVLQKPTITTLNHQSATIYIGQQIAIAGQTFTNGGVNNQLGFTTSTQYIPVRLQLDITPHIFNDDEVMLEFRQQNNDINGFNTIGGNRVPNISEQGMMNSLIVADRATAMLGGLITERDANNKNGLPFLVRIPVIKHLFGSTNTNKERRELIIFVQPRILPDDTTHRLEQARMADHSLNFDEAASFGGYPEEIIPTGEVPNHLLPTPGAAEPPKKTFFGKIKGIFNRRDND